MKICTSDNLFTTVMLILLPVFLRLDALHTRLPFVFLAIVTGVSGGVGFSLLGGVSSPATLVGFVRETEDTS